MSSTGVQELPSQANEEGDEKTYQELYQYFTNLVSSLPSHRSFSVFPLYRHDKGWHANMLHMVGSMLADECFTARPSDIVVATFPKSGTTWIKALLYATVHRREHPVDAPDHPFHSLGPHECIKSLELQLYGGNKMPDLDKLQDPRLFATHVPYVSLPRTTVAATPGCKIVYVCRDPKDTFISLWHFINRGMVRRGREPLSLETAAELFCDGLFPFGPYWDHVLGYWRAHLVRPDQVLFFTYEEITRDTAAHVRRLADFVGRTFCAEEEERGVVDAVLRLCAFEHMSGLEATKRGKTELVAAGTIQNSSFFRRGVVGDWANHLSPEMAQRIDAITEAKFRGSGICF